MYDNVRVILELYGDNGKTTIMGYIRSRVDVGFYRD